MSNNKMTALIRDLDNNPISINFLTGIDIAESGVIKGTVSEINFNDINIEVIDNKAIASVDIKTNGHSTMPIGFTCVQPWLTDRVISDAGVWLRLDGSPIDKYQYLEISNNINVLVPQSEIPAMTANSFEEFTALSSSNYDASSLPFNAFNKNPAKLWWSGANTVTASTGVVLGNQFLQIKKVTPFKINGYGIQGIDTSNCPRNWTLFGTNDNVQWDVLDTRVDTVTGNIIKYFFCETTMAYTTYRLSVTKVGVTSGTSYAYFAINEFVLFEDKVNLINIPRNSDGWYTYVKAKSAPFNEQFKGTPGKDALDKHMSYKLIVSDSDINTIGDNVVKEPLLPMYITPDTEYRFPNPFNKPCISTIELSHDGVDWFTINSVYNESFFGCTINSVTDTIVMSTGPQQISSTIQGASAPANSDTNQATLMCRIHCWSIVDTPVFPYIYTSRIIANAGDWKYFHEKQAPSGWHIRDGSIINDVSVKYPDLIAHLSTASWKCVTEAYWQNMLSKASGKGGVPFYVHDVEKDTLRLPYTYNDYITDGSIADIETWKSDAQRPIVGQFSTMLNTGSVGADKSITGAFKFVGGVGQGSNTGTAPNNYAAVFNSENVTPVDTTNHPRTIYMLGCVCLETTYAEPVRDNLCALKECTFESPGIGYEETNGNILADISIKYLDFVNKYILNSVNDKWFITEEEWQAKHILSQTDDIPYFVYDIDNDTLRLPRISGTKSYNKQYVYLGDRSDN